MRHKDPDAIKYWRMLITERINSGLSITEWCNRKNVRESQYYYWLKIIRKMEEESKKCEQEFSSSVKSQDSCRKSGSLPNVVVAVVKKGDILIEITESASVDFLANIIEAVANV